MLEDLSIVQLDEYRAMFELQPYGYDVLHGMIARLIQFVAASAGQTVEFAEVMPTWSEPVDDDRVIDVDEMQLVQLFGGDRALMEQIKELQEKEKNGDNSSS